MAQRLEDIYLEAHMNNQNLNEEAIFQFIDFQIKTIFSKIMLSAFEIEVILLLK